MAFRKVLPIVFWSFLLFFCVFVTLNFVIAANGAIFVVRNNCPYTIWAAGVPGGGKRLNQNETWFVVAKPGQTQGRIWARTNCSFDIFGQGRCKTGDCNGLLKCKSYGQAPNTLAEYAIGQFDQDFFDISVVDGFNIPIKFGSLSRNCSRVIRCTGDIIEQCPNELKVIDGCNGPCPVFKTNEYCCNSSNCEPTTFSRFFKERCPYVYSYPKDDSNSTFICPTGSHYEVTFCPLAEKGETTFITPTIKGGNDQQDYLNAHNAARAQVGVANIVWDNTVAAYAQSYANSRVSDCDLVHSGGPYGENLAEGSGTFTGTAAVNLWVAEKPYYNYISNSCTSGKQCRHYTQVVWRDSVRIGCARVQCTNGWWFVTCNYDPPGNYVGERPY